jgi:outer membrane receptor protein involved in Fe transport
MTPAWSSDARGYQMKNQSSSRPNSHLRTAIRAALAVPVAVVIAPAPALSQEADGVEEIVVTATRREGTIQDVPINIAAIDGTRIEEQGFKGITELLSYVPGINAIDQGGRNGNETIVRGINADPLGQGGGNDNGTTVATYVGDIPIPIDLRLHDLQRVEVLLGPQGTLYGAGTLGGAIRYIPFKPDTSETLFEVRGNFYSISEGSDLSTDIGFTANIPVSDTFAIRGSVDWLDDKGYVDYPFVVQQPGVSEPDIDPTDAAAVAANFNPAKDANGQEVISGRIAARWLPTDSIDATLTYYFQSEDNEGRTVSSARGAYPSPRYASASRVLEPNEEDNELIALEIIADLGFAELTSATGFGTYEEVGQRDQTDLLISLEYSYEVFPTFTAFTREEEEEEFFNQEIRLVSTSDSRFNWIVGGFYNKFETVGSSSEFTPEYAQFAGFNRPDNLEYFSAGTEQVEEQAIFGEIGFEITDRWQITVGGRYYEYDVQAQSEVDFPLFDPGFVAASLAEIETRPFDPDLRQKDDGTLYKFNTSFEISDQAIVYATVSEGFRIGASNGGGPCPPYDPNAIQGNCNLAPGQQFGPGPDDFAEFDERAYGPDTTTNYELGAKTQWLGGALTLNGAIFLVEWDDPQLSSATVNASIPITINANGAESTGFELFADWAVTDQLRVHGTYSYTKSELTADVPSLIRTITPPGFGTAFEDGLDGDRLPGSPESQFSILASYDYDLASGNALRFNASYAWQDDILSRTGARGNSLNLDSFGLANVSAVYDAEMWSVTVYVHNLFDEFAESGVQSSAPFNQAPLGATVRSYLTQILRPQTIGARFKYRF